MKRPVVPRLADGANKTRQRTAQRMAGQDQVADGTRRAARRRKQLVAADQLVELLGEGGLGVAAGSDGAE
jgi:hypothetical protein